MFKTLNGLKEMRESLAGVQATGSAGDNRVQVEVSGLGVVTRLTLSPDLVAENDSALLEELIPQALNEALTKVRQMHIDKVREATAGIELPGLEEALTSL